MKESKIYTLSNGIRVVHQYLPLTDIVHCGIFLDIGSRDETAKNQGIAHFWEHMAFKGTTRRKSYQIINSLDAVGGELNAYTEKERIVFHASVRNNYFERAVDVLTDITFDSIFPEKEIEKERSVILEEMSMYKDDPEDTLQDEFENLLFGPHPMGMNILGTPATVKAFGRKDFIAFISKHLDTHRIVFSCAGNIRETQLLEIVRRYLEVIPEKRSRAVRSKFNHYKKKEAVLKRPVKQSRCGIGRDAFSVQHKYRIPFFLLVNILGGPGMNSKLNMALRERNGLVYSVEGQYVPYSDTGQFAIFFGTEPRHLDKCLALIKKEFDKLCDKPLNPRQLASAKEQIKGQLAIGEENNLNLMLIMGRSVLDFGRVPSLAEIFDKIDAIDPLILCEVAGKMLNDRTLSCLIMEPDEANGRKRK